ncbi:MAG: hypothetical protein OP8BY_1751 [Candidatus Saccharicenans subterraneus]|uniref:Uncharacterized protein n=1 Tax=Candidatus Saccharicenans subterraneus TaxID=2508984 RepID=A0A3E2BP87_9BACT|nr:MAG: hypothetical protein OP8BY_1751 [Candidatus Saccharicenans subterraneum]
MKIHSYILPANRPASPPAAEKAGPRVAVLGFQPAGQHNKQEMTLRQVNIVAEIFLELSIMLLK